MLDSQQFVVKERTALLKMANAYDILDPNTKAPVAVAQEKPNMLMRIIFKEKAPTAIEVRDTQEQLVFSVKKPFALLGRPKIGVFDASGAQLGYFVSKILSIGGGFTIYSPDGKNIGEVKGNWKSKEFQILGSDKQELGKVSKSWGGMAKELFTSSDTYVVGVADCAANDKATKMLVLGAALTIDIVLKE